MSYEQILAEVLRLPSDERRELVRETIKSLPDSDSDPDMTPELRAELDRRYQNMLEHPEDAMTWEEVCAELDKRKNRRA